MQKYVYVKSPMKAAQLLERGFSYIKTPFNSKENMFVFALDEALQHVLSAEFIQGHDYIVRDGALIAF